MTTYNVVFDESQYRANAKRVAKYYQAKAMGAGLPTIKADPFDAYSYRYTYFSDPIAGSAGNEWSAHGKKGTVMTQYTDYDLYTNQLDMFYDLNDTNKQGASLIEQRKKVIYDKWILNVDYEDWHGPIAAFGGQVGTGTQLAEGLIGQLTSIENLDGTDSLLNVKGDIWYALNTMIDGIPFNIRQEGPPMILITDETFGKETQAPDRIYNDLVEHSFIRKYLMSDEAIQGRKIGSWIVNNNILCKATDDTDGANADTVDTVGTHSRAMLIVPDERWVARVKSRGISLVGEDSGILGTQQIWGTKGRALFFNTDCAEFSEAITWA